MEYKYLQDGSITSPRGYIAGASRAAVKKSGRYDVALMVSSVPAVSAGVFTTNKFQAAPVRLCREYLQKGGKMRGFVVNSGCANACTGRQGLEDARSMTLAAAEAVGCKPEEILVASTGVIGMPLPMDRVVRGIKEAAAEMSETGGHVAAQAIMTTDTFAKETALCFELDGKNITIGAMAKGSGMIHPNMATMLGFITTDASISPECLQKALEIVCCGSFNMVSVDGDTSTNDSLIIFANGLAGNKAIDDEKSADFALFLEGLKAVGVDLAKMIARDGEGATKLLEVRVINACSEESARKGARSIVTSNLVKAAVFGEDANWGRIVCALGYSGADFDPDRVDVYLGEILVAKDGGGLAFDEDEARRVLSGKEITVTVDLKQGCASATAWGCDLTYDYVKINGSYRT